MEQIGNLLNKNLELAKLSSGQRAISNEEKLSEAIAAAKVAERPQENLKEVLRLIMVKMGLREQNWPSDAGKVILISHIEEYFGNHSPEEIKLAFDMAINGKIGDTEDFANCYENFSCAFFSKVMNAYRKWAATEVKYLPKKQPEKIETPEGRADWTDVYNTFLNMDEVDARSIPCEIYDWLFYCGKFKLSSDEKRELLKRAIPVRREWLYAEITRQSTPQKKKAFESFNLQVANDDFMPDTIEELKKVGKKIFVKEYMQKEKTPA